MIPISIRAGQGHPSFQTDDDAVLSPLQMRLLSLLVIMMRKAGETAATYTEHAERTKPTAEDFIRGLKYQAHHFLNQVTEEEVDAMQGQMFGESEGESDGESNGESEGEINESSSSSSSSSSDNDAPILTDDDEAFTVTGCRCEVCMEVERIADSWEQWKPEGDDVYMYLKTSIDTIVERVNEEMSRRMAKKEEEEEV